MSGRGRGEGEQSVSGGRCEGGNRAEVAVGEREEEAERK